MTILHAILECLGLVRDKPQDDPPPPPVDIAAVMDERAAAYQALRQRHQPLDWRHSVVDTLKALGLDDSQAARDELAAELHCAHPAGTAEGNEELRVKLLECVRRNGGNVPEELL